MKKGILFTAVLSVYFFLSSCTISQIQIPDHQDDASDIEDAKAKVFLEYDDKSSLYILLNAPSNLYKPFDVEINEKWVGYVQKGRFFKLLQESGEYYLDIDYRKADSDDFFMENNIYLHEGELALIVCDKYEPDSILESVDWVFSQCTGDNYEKVGGISACVLSVDSALMLEGYKDKNEYMCAPVENTEYFMEARLAESRYETIPLTEESAFKKAIALNTVEALEGFLEQYPESPKMHEVWHVLQPLYVQQGIEQREAKANEIIERDANLSRQIAKDKYMVSLTSYLKNQDFENALLYFNVLDKLNMPLPDAMNFFWGESLIFIGETDEALEKLYAYVLKAGRGGKYYSQALQKISSAEQSTIEEPVGEESEVRKIMAEKILQRDAGLPIEIAKDKYMASLTRYLKEKDYIEALKYFEVLDRLNTPLPDSITYFWGESLLSRRESKAALEKLYAYVQKAGEQGKYYTKALQLITEAEAQLD